MSDHNININFPSSGSGQTGNYQQNNQQNNYQFNMGGGSSTQYLNQVLQSLNSTINNLNKNINTIINKIPKESKEKKDVWDSVGKTIGTSIASVVGLTLKRFLDIESNAIMSRAVSSGQFMAATIKGNANDAFGGYVNSLFQTEKARQQANTSNIAEGAFGAIGAAGGAIAGGFAAPVTGGIVNPLSLGLAGYMGGKSFGNFVSADERARQEKMLQVKGALAERSAMASVSEWKTGFSRFGLSRTGRDIVPAGYTDDNKAINVPLSQQFENKYGKSQNYNAIQNNITPYLQSSPLDSQKTGDLAKVSQNFLKAGFAVQDFSKLTMQSSQYQAITGKNIQQFSEYVKDARSKFGDAFDVTTNQTALNLMTLGYSKNQAQNVAFQSQYNSGMNSNVSKFNNLGIQDYYKNKAVGDALGIDINQSLKSGSFVGDEFAKKELRKELDKFTDTKEYGNTMAILNAGLGLSPQDISSLLQDKVSTLNKPVNEQSGVSPAQDRGATEIIDILRNGLSNVQNMNVNAKSVVIMNSGDKIAHSTLSGDLKSFFAPSVAPVSTSPTK